MNKCIAFFLLFLLALFTIQQKHFNVIVFELLRAVMIPTCPNKRVLLEIHYTTFFYYLTHAHSDKLYYKITNV